MDDELTPLHPNYVKLLRVVTGLGYRDDIVIRLTATPTGTRVDMRSKSRVGESDLGDKVGPYPMDLARRLLVDLDRRSLARAAREFRREHRHRIGIEAGADAVHWRRRQRGLRWRSVRGRSAVDPAPPVERGYHVAGLRDTHFAGPCRSWTPLRCCLRFPLALD